MGTLKARLRTDLTAAMRARDTMRVGTLRLTLAAITTEEVSGAAARELDDAQEQVVLTREVRKRREAAQTYSDASRTEMAATELAEAAIIEGYLPQQLDDEQLAGIVDEALQRVAEQTGNAPGRAQMGQVMKLTMTAAAGRADGARLSAAVRAALAD